MSEPLDESYLKWLYAQVASVKVRTINRTWWALFHQMYSTEFIWFVPNDDNRVEDGRDLRMEFLREVQPLDVEESWMNLGCSVLEMLIGVARRLSFQADGPVDAWFWHIMNNVGLAKYTDAVQPFHQEVEEILDRLIWRQYEPDGKGGLFPLRRPEKDQRKIEIWYQLCAYVNENC